MPYQPPKTDWAAGNVPNTDDFKRIEENTRVLKEDTDNHADSTLPHKFTDGGTTYRWGFSVVSGVLMFNYEEVS